MADDSMRDPTAALGESVERFWDAVVEGRYLRPVTGFDEALGDTIRRVHALAGAPLPDPIRAEQLWRDLMNTHSAAIPLRIPSARPEALNGRTATRPPLARAASRLRDRTRSMPRWISFAVTFAIVAAILGGIFFAFHSGQRAAAPPAGTPTTAPSSSDAWPMFRGDPARTGTVNGPGPVGQAQVIWTFKAPGLLYNPVVDRRQAFVESNQGVVYAIDVSTGKQIWTFDTGSISATADVYAFPVIGGDSLFVGSQTGSMIALNRSDGSKRWTFTTSGPVVASPVLNDRVLYFGDKKGAFYALDAATGTQKWTIALNHPIDPLPAFDGGSIYQSDFDGDLWSLDAATGAVRWKINLGAPLKAPGVGGGSIFIADKSSTFYAIDASTGAIRWKYSSPAKVETSAGAITLTMVVVNVAATGTVALDARTGAKIWAAHHSATAYGPTIAGSTVYSGDDGNQVVELDVATGKQLGALSVSGSPSSSAIAAGILYSGNEDGTLTAFGSTASATTASPSASSPVAPRTASPLAGASGNEDGAQFTFLWSSVFGSAANLAFAPDGSIWAPDLVDGHIWIVDRDGNSLGSWGKGGSAPGEFTFKKQGQDSYWGGIAFGPDGSFAVAECGNQRFEIFDARRSLVKSVGENGVGDGEFLCPSAIVYGKDGTIFVADLYRNVVQHFTANGTFIGKFTTPAGPCGLILTSAGDVVVTETGAGQVQVVSPEGKVLLTFGSPGKKQGQFIGAVATTIDESGNFYVADQFTNFLSVFDANGTFVGTLGTEGVADGQFANGVDAIAYGGKGSLYTVDYPYQTGARLQKFQVRVTHPAAEASPIASPSA